MASPKPQILDNVEAPTGGRNTHGRAGTDWKG